MRFTLLSLAFATTASNKEDELHTHTQANTCCSRLHCLPFGFSASLSSPPLAVAFLLLFSLVWDTPSLLRCLSFFYIHEERERNRPWDAERALEHSYDERPVDVYMYIRRYRRSHDAEGRAYRCIKCIALCFFSCFRFCLLLIEIFI